MKTIILAILSLTLISATKDKTVFKPRAEFFGTYAKADKPEVKEWTLKPLAKDSNKIAFYHNKDVDFMFYVVMKDSTHFGTKSGFTQQIDGQPTQTWSAKGEFLPGGQMKIAIKTSDAGLKLTVDLEAQEKILYIKK
jgi:hypothetical protein